MTLSAKQELIVACFDSARLGACFPENYFTIEKNQHLSKDLFVSVAYFGLPWYYIDFQTLLVSKSFLSLKFVRARVLSFRPWEVFRELQRGQPEVFSFLVNIGRLMFPLYFLNESTGQISLFGCLEFQLFQELSRSKIELVLFPLEFMNSIQESNIGLNEQSSGGMGVNALTALLARCQSSGEAPTFSIKSERKEEDSYGRKLMVEGQQRLLADVQKERQKLLKQLTQLHESFLNNHRKLLCVYCNSLNTPNKKLNRAQKEHIFGLNILNVLARREGNVVVHFAGKPVQKFDFADNYPIIEPSFVTEVIPFGNPFQKIIKRNTEKSEFLLSENDQQGIKTIQESHILVRQNYMNEKRATLKRYKEHVANFDESEFDKGLKDQLKELVRKGKTYAFFESETLGQSFSKTRAIQDDNFDKNSKFGLFSEAESTRVGSSNDSGYQVEQAQLRHDLAVKFGDLSDQDDGPEELTIASKMHENVPKTNTYSGIIEASSVQFEELQELLSISSILTRRSSLIEAVSQVQAGEYTKRVKNLVSLNWL